MGLVRERSCMGWVIRFGGPGRSTMSFRPRELDICAGVGMWELGSTGVLGDKGCGELLDTKGEEYLLGVGVDFEGGEPIGGDRVGDGIVGGGPKMDEPVGLFGWIILGVETQGVERVGGGGEFGAGPNRDGPVKGKLNSSKRTWRAI